MEERIVEIEAAAIYHMSSTEGTEDALPRADSAEEVEGSSWSCSIHCTLARLVGIAAGCMTVSCSCHGACLGPALPADDVRSSCRPGITFQTDPESRRFGWLKFATGCQSSY